VFFGTVPGHSQYVPGNVLGLSFWHKTSFVDDGVRKMAQNTTFPGQFWDIPRKKLGIWENLNKIRFFDIKKGKIIYSQTGIFLGTCLGKSGNEKNNKKSKEMWKTSKQFYRKSILVLRKYFYNIDQKLKNLKKVFKNEVKNQHQDYKIIEEKIKKYGKIPETNLKSEIKILKKYDKKDSSLMIERKIREKIIKNMVLVLFTNEK